VRITLLAGVVSRVSSTSPLTQKMPRVARKSGRNVDDVVIITAIVCLSRSCAGVLLLGHEMGFYDNDPSTALGSPKLAIKNRARRVLLVLLSAAGHALLFKPIHRA
jgi:hypothetical protein